MCDKQQFCPLTTITISRFVKQNMPFSSHICHQYSTSLLVGLLHVTQQQSLSQQLKCRVHTGGQPVVSNLGALAQSAILRPFLRNPNSLQRHDPTASLPIAMETLPALNIFVQSACRLHLYSQQEYSYI